MDLKYTFDPKRFYLGGLCKRKHCWPGTNQSLRRLYVLPSGAQANSCVGCTGRKQSNWLISFVDIEAMGLPSGASMGKLCPGGHRWMGHEMTLKMRGSCPACAAIRKRSTKYKAQRASKTQTEEYRQRSRHRYAERCLDLNFQEQKKTNGRAAMQRLRRRRAAAGLTTRGTAPVIPDNETRQLHNAIRRAGRLPNVADLVQEAQRDFWRDNAEEYHLFCAKRRKQRHQWRYLIDPSYRFYNRQKKKRRKALQLGSFCIQVKGWQVNERFSQFGNRCAYCGATGNLHIEHLIPVAKGGTHTLGNIIPACQRCNLSKATKEAEQWYRAQSFFCERRWIKIRRVLGLTKGSAGQLTLL